MDSITKIRLLETATIMASMTKPTQRKTLDVRTLGKEDMHTTPMATQHLATVMEVRSRMDMVRKIDTTTLDTNKGPAEVLSPIKMDRERKGLHLHIKTTRDSILNLEARIHAMDILWDDQHTNPSPIANKGLTQGMAIGIEEAKNSRRKDVLRHYP